MEVENGPLRTCKSGMTTPPKITDAIRRLCLRVVPKGTPTYISVAPTHVEKLNDCFNVVDHQIANHGGSKRHGWIIWEWPSVLLQAEFHAVWVSATNKVFDISPKPDGEKRILFLPDPSRTYDGKKRVPNEWHAISDLEEVAGFISMSQIIDGFCEDVDPTKYTDEDRKLLREAGQTRQRWLHLIHAKMKA